MKINCSELSILLKTQSERQTAKMLSVGRGTVQYYRKKCGLSASLGKSGHWRKWRLDEEFFDVIDSEVKAYSLGLIAADGHLDKKNMALIIQLIEPDIATLEKINSAMRSNRPLLRIPVEKIGGFGANHAQIRLVAQSKYLFERLAETKVKELMPDLKPELELAYLRGLIDGDGHLTHRQCYIVGSPTLLQQVSDKFGFTFREINEKKARLTIGKPSGLIQQVYANPEIFIARKYAVVKEHWL